MQQTFTREFMAINCGCYSDERLSKCSFMQAETITLKSIFDSEIPLKDKYWFLCRVLATKRQNQEIAIHVAELVLPIYERKYPDDKRPREAIFAARQFLAGAITLDELIAKRRDASAAADADADASAAAAYAYAAASAAAAYAYAYAAAAADADAYAYADDIKKQLQNYLFTFIEKTE